MMPQQASDLVVIHAYAVTILQDALDEYLVGELKLV